MLTSLIQWDYSHRSYQTAVRAINGTRNASHRDVLAYQTVIDIMRCMSLPDDKCPVFRSCDKVWVQPEYSH